VICQGPIFPYIVAASGSHSYAGMWRGGGNPSIHVEVAPTLTAVTLLRLFVDIRRVRSCSRSDMLGIETAIDIAACTIAEP
jgi:hypothetical protein